MASGLSRIDGRARGQCTDQSGRQNRWPLIRQPEASTGEDRLAGGIVPIPTADVLAAPQGKPRTAVGAAVRASLRGDSLTALTALTVLAAQLEQSGSPRARAPTDSESTPKDQVPRSKMRGESIDLRLASQDATRYTRERASARSLRSGGVHTALCTTC